MPISRSSLSGWILRTSLALAVLVCLSVAPARAQVGPAAFNPAQQTSVTAFPDADDLFRLLERRPGVTPRSIGTAGASVAGIGDLSALYVNPAGLGYAASSEVTAGFSVVTSQTESTFRAPGDAAGLGLEASQPNTALSNLGVLYKVPTERGTLVFAAAYQRVASFVRETEYEGDATNTSVTGSLLPDLRDIGGQRGDITFPVPSQGIVAFDGGAIEYFPGDLDQNIYPFQPAVFPGSTIRQIGSVNRGGSVNEASFGAGFEAAQDVMVGGGANIVFGTYRFRQELVELDVNGDNNNYEVIRGNDVFTGLDQILYRDEYEDQIVGFNLRLGVSAKLSPEIKLGVAFESPTWTSVSRDYTIAAVQTTFDTGGQLSYGIDPRRSASERDGRDEVVYDVRTPLRLRAGLAYDTDRLGISGDVEFVDASQINLEEQARGQNVSLIEVQNAIEDNYSYVFNLRGGVEYRLEEGLDVRGGIAYRPDPREGRVLATTTERDRLFLSAGLGYAVNDQFRIDVGWMQQRVDDQFRPYDPTSFEYKVSDTETQTATYDAPIVSEDAVQNVFTLGVSFGF